MNEPRPAMISARPPDSRSSVAKSWNTRTGSSEEMTLTALVRRIRSVREAAAAEHDGRRRDGEVGPVVLADAEHIEADLVGELDLLDQIADALLRADDGAGRVRRALSEGVDAEFHGASQSSV